MKTQEARMWQFALRAMRAGMVKHSFVRNWLLAEIADNGTVRKTRKPAGKLVSLNPA